MDMSKLVLQISMSQSTTNIRNLYDYKVTMTLLGNTVVCYNIHYYFNNRRSVTENFRGGGGTAKFWCSTNKTCSNFLWKNFDLMRKYRTPKRSNFTGVISTNAIPPKTYSTGEQFN